MAGRESHGAVLAVVAALAPLAGCVSFPEVEAAESAYVEAAAYPDLVPIESLLTAPPPRATPEVRAGVEAQAGGLRARAEALRRPILTPEERARLDREITVPETPAG